MKRFIELHQKEEPILLNLDCIAYIKNVDNEAIIYLKYSINNVTTLSVKESYDEVINIIKDCEY